MNTGFTFLMSLAAALLAASCGRSPEVSSVSDDSKRPLSPVLVFAGGFNSCGQAVQSNLQGQRIYRAAHELRASISQEFTERKPIIIHTCFAKDASYVRMYRNDSVMPRKIAVSEFPRFVRETVEGLERPGVFIHGHSYGGWLSVKTAQGLTQDQPVVSLGTLDPISPVGCAPMVYLRSRLGDIFGQNPVAGCTHAPADLKPIYAELAQRTVRGQWSNLYQNQAYTLHSSEIPEADHNDLIAFPGMDGHPTDAHVAIDEDGQLWSTLAQRALQGLEQVSR